MQETFVLFVILIVFAAIALDFIRLDKKIKGSAETKPPDQNSHHSLDSHSKNIELSSSEISLYIITKKQFEWSLRHSDEVTNLTIGADLVRELDLFDVLSKLEAFKDLKIIGIQDDYLDDSQMESIKSFMRDNYPEVSLHWTYALKPAGKYGR